MSEKERVYDLLFRLPDGRLVSGRFPGRVKQSDVVQALAQRYPDTVDDDMEIGSWPWWMTLVMPWGLNTKAVRSVPWQT